mgnify:FL=1
MDVYIENLVSYTSHQQSVDYWTLITLAFVSFAGSFLTAAIGIGGGSLVLASMTLFFSPAVLIPIHAIIQFGSNAGRASLMFSEISWHLVFPFIFGAFFGVLIGGALFISLPVSVLQSIIALFILYSTWSKKISAHKSHRTVLFFVGGGSSFLSMFVGATGPLIAPFVATACNTRHQIVSTHALLMSIQHGFKTIVFIFLGASIAPYCLLIFSMLLLGYLGTYIGKKLLDILPEKLFRKTLKWVLTAMAIRLLYIAVTQT